MDELTIDGKIYVSSKRAAAITGYAKDYIGQLCREGRVEAKLVGRSWYVYEPSLKKHRFSDSSEEEVPKAETAWGKPAVATSISSEKPNIQAAWEAPSYVPEEVHPLPELNAEPVSDEIERPEETPAESDSDETVPPLSDMQSAWQEWFSARASVDAGPAAPVREQTVEEPEEEEHYREPVERAQNVPLRTIVSDIAPVAREAEPVRDPYQAPTYSSALRPAMAVHVSERPKTRKRHAHATHRVMQAVFVAIIAVSASVALLSTGIIEALHLGGTADAGFIRFLQGETVVEK